MISLGKLTQRPILKHVRIPATTALRVVQVAGALVIGRLSDSVGRFPFLMLMHVLAFIGSLFGHFACPIATTPTGTGLFYVAFIMFGIFDACTQTQVALEAGAGRRGAHTGSEMNVAYCVSVGQMNLMCRAGDNELINQCSVARRTHWGRKLAKRTHGGRSAITKGLAEPRRKPVTISRAA